MIDVRSVLKCCEAPRIVMVGSWFDLFPSIPPTGSERLADDPSFLYWCIEPQDWCLNGAKGLPHDEDRWHFLPYAISDYDGQAPFLVSKVSDQSSSLRPYACPSAVPFKTLPSVEVRRLDTLVEAGELPFSANYVQIDAQGCSLDVIRGGSEFLNRCDMVYVEAEHLEIYKGEALWPEVKQAMLDLGFTLEPSQQSGLDWDDFLFTKGL